MQKITINQLGPVSHCTLEIKDFIVFTGPQASGKSTVAKSIFFFKNIKNILITQIRKQFLFHDLPTEDSIPLSAKNRLLKEIRSNFLQIFGSTWCMDRSMFLLCEYADGVSIKVSLTEDETSPNYIWIDFSSNLNKFLYSIDDELRHCKNSSLPDEHLSDLRKRINVFFADDMEIVYIPAGRSMITLLSTQLNYLYSSMDDTQKRNLDYCTQNYLERILMLKPNFSVSTTQMIQDTISLTDVKINKQLIFTAAELMKEILQGEYRNVSGEERLQVTDDRYVKINFASSGQQEAVWILNVLFYYLLNNKKTYFIIEEPESHLFPNAQKLIMEFISLVRGNKNQIFITTHSPYILGTINNLLYASKISKNVNQKELERIVMKEKWISFDDISAYFIDKGIVYSCMDTEFQSIENEVIDGASDDINNDYDKMILLKEKYCTKENV